MGGETGVSVGDYAAGQPEPWVQVLVVQLGNLGARDHALAWKEQRSAQAPMVNYGQDAVIASALWQACDQVHGYLCEWQGIRGNRYFV